MFVDEFYQDLVIKFNTFCTQDFLETTEELGSDCGFLFTSDGKINTGASAVEGFDDLVFVVAGEDESAVVIKRLNVRP